MKIDLLKLGLLFLCCANANAGPPKTPGPVVIAKGLDWCFVMVAKDEKMGRPAVARLYQVLETCKLQILWQIDDLYVRPEQVVFSSYGHNMVRMLDCRLDAGTTEDSSIGEHPLLEFYNNGKLARKVLVKEILTQPAAMHEDPSHKGFYFLFSNEKGNEPRAISYQDVAALPGMPDDLQPALKFDFTKQSQKEDYDGGVFVFDSGEGERFAFKMKNGELLGRWKVTKAQRPEESPLPKKRA